MQCRGVGEENRLDAARGQRSDKFVHAGYRFPDDGGEGGGEFRIGEGGAGQVSCGGEKFRVGESSAFELLNAEPQQFRRHFGGVSETEAGEAPFGMDREADLADVQRQKFFLHEKLLLKFSIS